MSDDYMIDVVAKLKLDWEEDNQGFRLFSDYLEFHIPREDLDEPQSSDESRRYN